VDPKYRAHDAVYHAIRNTAMKILGPRVSDLAPMNALSVMAERVNVAVRSRCAAMGAAGRPIGGRTPGKTGFNLKEFEPII
jgi:hypothetical protein